MRSLLWKELRENAKWAILAMLLLTGAEIYALFPKDEQEAIYSYHGCTLVRPAFLTITTFGCAGVGFILGLIQILPELRRDRWSALLHRPLTRGTLYRGKALAGLILYLVATVPPFLIAVWYTATPGHFSTPFVPGLVLPGTADICMGTAYYFAALATGLQRGGWLVLRAFPLLAAIHTSLFINSTVLFYVAVEAAVLMALLLFIAAWGEMLNQDVVGKRPWLARVAFYAMIFYGVCGTGELINSFAVSMVQQKGRSWDRYEFTDVGIPVKIIYDSSDSIAEVLNVDGTPVTDPRLQPDKIRSHLAYLSTFSYYIGDSQGYKPIHYDSTYREQSPYYWGNNPISYPKYQRWFYLTQEGYMVGYYPDTKQAFAILDQEGFKPITAKPVPFAPDVKNSSYGSEGMVFWTPNSIRYVFFDEQKIVDVPLPAPGPIYGVANASATKGRVSVGVTGFAFTTGMAVFDDKASLVSFLPYTRDVSQWGQIEMAINGNLDRFYLWYQPSGFVDSKSLWYLPPGSDEANQLAHAPSFIDATNREGNVVQSYTLPPNYSDPRVPRTWVMFLSHRMQTPAFFFGEIFYDRVGWLLGSDRLKWAFLWKLGSIYSHDDSRGNVIWLPPIYAILGLYALALARRVYFPWSRAVPWAFFVMAFGIPGLIVFRLASDWPSLVPCPQCRKPRPVDAEKCPVCGAGWHTPEKTGTEIFDDSRETVAAV